jgi:AcrR family transcriptional regulator
MEAVRHKLLRAAADCLAEHGMGASMNAIAQSAGVTKVTLYRYFESKEALVLAVMADHYDRLREIAEEVETATTGLEAIEAYLQRAIRQIGPDRRYFHVALMAGGTNAEIRASATGLDAAVGRLLERAQREDGVRDDVIPGDLHSLMLAMSSDQVDVLLAGLRSRVAVDEPPMRFEDYGRFQSERARRRELGELV